MSVARSRVALLVVVVLAGAFKCTGAAAHDERNDFTCYVFSHLALEFVTRPRNTERVVTVSWFARHFLFLLNPILSYPAATRWIHCAALLMMNCPAWGSFKKRGKLFGNASLSLG